MPDEMTRADSLRRYLSGAGSDGGAQSDPDASLGGYRSSSPVGGMGVSRAGAISNLTIDYAAPENGTGDGTLEATGSGTIRWTAPGGSAGADVAIGNGETKLVESGGESGRFLIVSRTSAASLTGTETVTLADVYNNVIGMGNVSSADAASGADHYRAIMLKNVNAVAISDLKAYLATLGTQAVSDSADLDGSGAGTITTTDSFADWPESGFCRIAQSGGTLREIVYYTSRTETSLTVPAEGRGMLGTSAAAGANDDKLDAVPGIRLASETPVSDEIQTIADEETAPAGVSWNTGIDAAGGIDLGTLAAGEMVGLWIHRQVAEGTAASPSVLNHIRYRFDAV